MTALRRMLPRITLAATLLSALPTLPQQQPAQQAASLPAASRTPFALLVASYLGTTHPPSPEEISAMQSLRPAPDAAAVAEALPLLLKSLSNPDSAFRAFALSTILGLRAAAAPATPPPATSPATYSLEIARLLTPAIPQIAAHLTTEEADSNRLITAAILGSFAPDPPASVFPPLIAFLRRDDAVSPVGQDVVLALFNLGPLSADSVTSISRYLRRPDQTSDSRANLTDLIATQTNQSQALNKTLLLFLNSDDNALRARVILSLPQLDLAPDVFADTKSRVEQLAGYSSENLQVVTAAKSVASCWTSTKMATGCPVY